MVAQSNDIDEIYVVGENFSYTHTTSKIQKFASVDALIPALTGRDWNGAFVFLKGSRGIKLEKILEKL